MKFYGLCLNADNNTVTLCVRVWIEIWKEPRAPADHLVTLCVRVWIEIIGSLPCRLTMLCHPLREGVD